MEQSQHPKDTITIRPSELHCSGCWQLTYLQSERINVYKLNWETTQLETDGSKKKNQALEKRRGTCFSFCMERCVHLRCECVHVKDRDGEVINFIPVITFFWVSTEDAALLDLQ